MTTIYRSLGTLRTYLGSLPWPEVFFPPDTSSDPASGSGASLLDQIYVIDSRMSPAASGTAFDVTLAVEGELGLAIPGLDGARLVFGSAEMEGMLLVKARVVIGQQPRLSLSNLSLALRFDTDLLRPADGSGYLEVAVYGSVSIDHNFDVTVTTYAPSSLPRCEIAGTGVIVSAEDVKLTFSRTESPQEILDAGFDESFLGLYLGQATLELPGSLADGAGSPVILQATGLALGTGGISGAVSAQMALQVGGPASGYALSGDLVGNLFGFEFGLAEVLVSFQQNVLVESRISGVLRLPFIDMPLGVDASFEASGEISVTLSSAQPQVAGVSGSGGGLVELCKEGLLTLALDGLTLETVDGAPQITLSGSIAPEFQPVPGQDLDWGEYGIQALTIDTQGRVTIQGGWLDLPQVKSINFFGFQLEISQIGFGQRDDGYRFVGFSGAIHLLEGLPLGGSVEGLKILWNDAGHIDFELAGIGVEFEIENTLSFAGHVAFVRDGSLTGFRGGVRLQLIALNMWLDAQVAVIRDQDLGVTGLYVFVDVGLPVGIPIFQTGVAIFGLAGLFAYNLLPGKSDDQEWYDWYADPNPEKGITHSGKWSKVQPGAFAFGAGMVLGVLPNGYAFSGEMLLVVLIPGPVLMIEGKAQFLSQRGDLGESEAQFHTFAVLDIPGGYYQFNVDASYVLPKDGTARGDVLDMGGGAEAYFNLGDMNAWHLYLGQKAKEKRLRADILNLFRADAYFMMEAPQVAMGSSIGFDEDWQFGPVRVALVALIEGEAVVSWMPAQFWGQLALEGGIDVRACGIRISLGTGADVELKTPAPYYLGASVWVRVKLPWPVKDFETRLELEWQKQAEPPVPVPLQGISVEHLKVSDKWDLAVSPVYDEPDNPGYYARASALPPQQVTNPVVPPDARIVLNFAKPVLDASQIGDNYTTPGAEIIDGGDYRFEYSLDAVSLFQRSGSNWIQVATPLYGMWQWKNDGDPENLSLMLWTHTPYEYTREMIDQAGFIQGLLNGSNYYPCDYPVEPEQICVDFEDFEYGHTFPARFQHQGFVFLAQAGNRIAKHQGPECPVTRALHIYHDGPVTIYPPEPLQALDLCIQASFEFELWVTFTKGKRATYPIVGKEQVIKVSPSAKVGLIEKLEIRGGAGYDIERICYVTEAAAAVGRAYLEQTQHLAQTLVEHWQGEAILLEPLTEYKVVADTAAVRAGPNGSAQEFRFSQEAHFQTGLPAGSLGAGDADQQLDTSAPTLYPGSGPLIDLSAYIQRTIPTGGGRFHYRGYDLGVEFNESYVEQMFLMAGAPLAIEISDNNDQPLRDETGAVIELQNAWGDNPSLTPSVSETFYARHVSAEECATITTTILPPQRGLQGLVSQPLEPMTPYTVHLRSSPYSVYRFAFTTSRYTGFADHISSYRDMVWRQAFSDDKLSDVEFEAMAAPVLAGEATYESLAAELGLGYRRPPEQLEITALHDASRTFALLLESPEPFDWGRIELAVLRMRGRGRTEEIVHQRLLNGDGTRGLLFRGSSDGTIRPWPPADYVLDWRFRLDIGPDHPVLKRNGDSADEVAQLKFTLK